MTNFVWSTIMFAAISSFSEAYQTFDFGNGIIHKLSIVQDVTLERTTNMDYLDYLLVARLTYYPLKRSLVQFESLRSTCPLNEIQYAKMYLYFAYAHRASFRSMKEQPYLKHTFQVYRVLKPWKEQEATIEYRQSGLKWNSTLLNIGNDTESEPQCGSNEESNCSPTTLYPPRPAGFMEFDVTKAMRSWRNGSQNYGLLVKVINEAANGRGIRFYSKSYSDSTKHSFIFVACNKRTIQKIQKDKKEEKKIEKDEEVEEKKEIVGAVCNQNSDATLSKPFWPNFFFNAVFASLYLMTL